MRISIDEKLPNELLTKILDYLPPHSLHAASRVSTRWFHIAQVLGVYHLVLPLQSIGNMIACVENHIPSTTEGARIRHMLILSDSILPHIVFRLIQQLCPNIVSFDYDPDILTTDMKTTSNRKRHKFLSGNFGWGDSIAHFPACHFGGDMQWTDPDLCHRLKTFYGHCESLPLTYWVKNYVNLKLPYLPLLHDLTLHIPFKMREKHLVCLSRHCTRLTTLTLRDIQLSCSFDRRVYGEDQANQVMPTVKTLKLEYIKFLYVRTFDYFSKKFPNVQSLTLSLDNQSFELLVLQRMGIQALRANIIILISSFKHLAELIVNVNGHKKKNSIMFQVWSTDWLLNYCNQLTRTSQLEHFKINYT
ncbi:unnamed protein product [Absidia cylindrospora]